MDGIRNTNTPRGEAQGSGTSNEGERSRTNTAPGRTQTLAAGNLANGLLANNPSHRQSVRAPAVGANNHWPDFDYVNLDYLLTLNAVQTLPEPNRSRSVSAAETEVPDYDPRNINSGFDSDTETVVAQYDPNDI